MAKVLSVGQCGYDDSRIGALIRNVAGAMLDRADSPDEAKRLLREKKYALVLVNRVFDAGTGKGVELIADLKGVGSEFEAATVMLVSDYDDAQQAAVAAGAVPGFGKSSLATPTVADMLRKVIDLAENPAASQ